MVVASMHLGLWSWSRQSPELQTECQNRKERCNFEHGMVVGARWDVWEFYNLLSYWDFHAQPFLTKTGVKREKHPEKYPVCGGPVGKNALLMQTDSSW